MGRTPARVYGDRQTSGHSERKKTWREPLLAVTLNLALTARSAPTCKPPSRAPALVQSQGEQNTRRGHPRGGRSVTDGAAGIVCGGQLDRSMRASERRHDLSGESPDALSGGLSAVKQDVPDADRAQGFEFCSDSVGRSV